MGWRFEFFKICKVNQTVLLTLTIQIPSFKMVINTPFFYPWKCVSMPVFFYTVSKKIHFLFLIKITSHTQVAFMCIERTL